MKTKFSPATDTLAVMAQRGTATPVEKYAAPQDCILVTMLVSIIRGIFTNYREGRVSLKAGQVVYFVQSERIGFSYLVFLYSDGSSLCSCKDGRNHRPCQHTEDAVSYEALLAQEDERLRKEAEEMEIAECTAAVKSAKRRKTAKSVTVLYSYVFKHLNRACFVVLSDEGQRRVDSDPNYSPKQEDTYNTCFDNGQGSCTCKGHAEFHLECYHIKQLAPIAKAKLASVHAKVTDTRDKRLFAGTLQADAIFAAMATRPTQPRQMEEW